MGKKWLSFFAVTVFFASILTKSAQAQPYPNPYVKKQTWSCLSITSKFSPLQSAVDEKIPIKLSGLCQPTGSDSCYIVGCIGTDENAKCTTGNDLDDKTLGFGPNNFSAIRNKLNDPLFSSSASGSAKIAAEKKTGAIAPLVNILSQNNLEWYFFAVSQQVVQRQEEIVVTGTQKADEKEIVVYNPPAGSCRSVRIEPFGVIFDSQSLEPLPGVVVSILDADKNIAAVTGLPATTTTIVDGAFNFLIDPGTYYLSPELPAGYAFSPQPFIHPNYTKAYKEIYRPDEPIEISLGINQHRDIPLDPGVNPPYRSQPTLIHYSSFQYGTLTQISGQQSHPLTTVSIRQADKEIASTTADRHGFFEFSIANSQIRADLPINLYLTKIDLTASTQNEQIGATKKAISLSPQPPYLEGVAVNATGDIIANARVRIKLAMSNTIYYETEADSRGVFVVPPEFAPKTAYYLEFSPPNSLASLEMAIHQFAELNFAYLKSNNINLMTATKNGRFLIAQRVNPTQDVKPPANDDKQAIKIIQSPTPPPKPKTIWTNNIKIIFMIAGAIFFIIIAFFLLFLRKKHHELLIEEVLPENDSADDLPPATPLG